MDPSPEPGKPRRVVPDRLNRFRYALYAPIYDRLVGVFNRPRQEAIEALGLHPGQRVLIVGCGTGLDLDSIPKGVVVVGMDLTPGMIARAEARASRLGHEAGFQIGDARELSHASGSFDVVLLHLILAVAPEPERIVREADRVLVPGGTISIFDKFLPAGQRPGWGRRAINRVARLVFSELNRTVEPLIASVGWRIQADQPTGFRGTYRRIVAVKAINDGA